MEGGEEDVPRSSLSPGQGSPETRATPCCAVLGHSLAWFPERPLPKGRDIGSQHSAPEGVRGQAPGWAHGSMRPSPPRACGLPAPWSRGSPDLGPGVLRLVSPVPDPPPAPHARIPLLVPCVGGREVDGIRPPLKHQGGGGGASGSFPGKDRKEQGRGSRTEEGRGGSAWPEASTRGPRPASRERAGPRLRSDTTGQWGQHLGGWGSPAGKTRVHLPLSRWVPLQNSHPRTNPTPTPNAARAAPPHPAAGDGAHSHRCMASGRSAGAPRRSRPRGSSAGGQRQRQA